MTPGLFGLEERIVNHIYKIVFNARTGLLQVVQENAHSRNGKSRSSGRVRLLSTTILLGSSCAFAADLPTGADVTYGNATITTPTATSMQIDQTSNKLITNWQSFDIGKGNQVNFNQPSASSVALNRVVGTDGSKIMGTLTANGKVFIVNPNGVVFGKDASVSTAGLVASTLDIKDKDFIDGKYRFEGKSGASVINEGKITAENGGAVALLGGKVSNQGVIVAKKGSVALAAGEAITLDFNGDGLVSVQIDKGTKDALVENHQLIEADGGTVILTAKAADALVQNVVENTGIVRARSIENRDGHIVLNGGDNGKVAVSGTLDASSTDGQGGQIQVTGRTVEVTSANLDVSGAQGGGSIEVGGGNRGAGELAHAEEVSIDAASTLNADATKEGDGGKIVAWSEKQTVAHGVFSARGAGKGNGGSIETSGKKVVLEGIKVDTRAQEGKTGNWLIDPDEYTVGADGDQTGAALSAALESTDITLEADSNIYINDAVSWSANTLTMTAGKSIYINDVMTATDTAGLVTNYGSGTDADGVPYGLYTAAGDLGAFAGRIDFSSIGEVMINGDSYTVINDTTGLLSITENGNYILGSNVTWTTTANIPIFGGIFNGFGHIIFFRNNSTVNATKGGLFGTLTESASVSNLGVGQGAAISGSGLEAVGRLANINRGNIVNTFGNGAVQYSGSAGLLVGINYGLIAQSYVYGATLNPQYVAGAFVGTNEVSGRIIDCFASALTLAGGYTYVDVSSTTYAATVTYLSGFVGINRGEIKRSWTNYHVTTRAWTSTQTPNFVGGGFVGLNEGYIDQSYASKIMPWTSGNNYSRTAGEMEKVGGFVGINEGEISNAYAYDTLTGHYSKPNGGFAYENSGTIRNSYAYLADNQAGANVQQYGFVAVNSEGSVVINSYWNVATETSNPSTPPLIDASGATKLGNEAAGDLNSYVGFDPTIWGSAVSGFPLLKALNKVVVFSASNNGKIYGTEPTEKVFAAGLQAGDTVASTLQVNTSALSNGYLDVGTYNVNTIFSASPYDLRGKVAVAPKALTYGAIASKEYDGTTTGSFVGEPLEGFVADQTLTVNDVEVNFNDKNAGAKYDFNILISMNVSDGENGGKLSNYQLPTAYSSVWTGVTPSITPRVLDASVLYADVANKTYDGNTNTTASIGSTDAVALADINAGELTFTVATANYVDANAGTDKTVMVNGFALDGSGKGNYSLTTNTISGIGNIAPRTINVFGSSASDPGDTVAASSLAATNVVSGDTVTLAGTAELLTRNPGPNSMDISGVTLDNPNYTLVGAVTQYKIGDAERVLVQNSYTAGVTFDSEENPTNIITNNDKAYIDWQLFSIRNGVTVHFEQPHDYSVVLNRVLGGVPSQIFGTLSSNGRVFILNANGVLFKHGSQVDVAALVASTMNLSNENFDNDAFVFTASGGDGTVVNEGDIVIVDKGFLALASENGVSSTGEIRARKEEDADQDGDGDAVLASAEKLTLTLHDTNSSLTGYQLSVLSGTTTVGGNIKLGNGLLETAGRNVTDNANLTAATRSITLPSITIGTGGTFSSSFVVNELEIRNFSLNSLEGETYIKEDITWNANTTLGLRGKGQDGEPGIIVQSRITANGESAKLTLTGGYFIDTFRTRLDHLEEQQNGLYEPIFETVGYANSGITLGGANSGLNIDGHDYILLHTMADFENINTIAGGQGAGYYALGQDITNTNIYTAAVVENLSGTLAGLGNVIKNLTIFAPGVSKVGLVGNAVSGAVLRDLGLENVDIVGGSYVGALLGNGLGVDGNKIIIDNIWVNNGKVVGDEGEGNGPSFVGGMIGRIAHAILTRVSTDVEVESRGSVWKDPNPDNNNGRDILSNQTGGLAGEVIYSTIKDASAKGTVLGGDITGGLIGSVNGDITIENSWAEGDVNTILADFPDGKEGGMSDGVGGLIGAVLGGESHIRQVSASGNVTGVWANGGGLIGAFNGSNSTLDYAASSGDVISLFVQNGHHTCHNLGLLIGTNQGTVDHVSATGTVDGGEVSMNIGLLVGQNDNTGVIGANYTVIGHATGSAQVGVIGDNKGEVLGRGRINGTANDEDVSNFYPYDHYNPDSDTNLIGDPASQGVISDAISTRPDTYSASSLSNKNALSGITNSLLSLLNKIFAGTSEEGGTYAVGEEETDAGLKAVDYDSQYEAPAAGPDDCGEEDKNCPDPRKRATTPAK
jgi:filamentous hemagglutinin family protein